MNLDMAFPEIPATFIDAIHSGILKGKKQMMLKSKQKRALLPRKNLIKHLTCFEKYSGGMPKRDKKH